MTVDDVLKQPSAFIGREIGIRGHLVSDLSTILISTCNTGQQQILIKHPHIQERLLEVVPCYVSGTALYSDESRVTGRLMLEDDSVVLYPRQVEILRSGEEHYIVELPV